ncbi:MAG: hypothetical protein Q4D94_13470 [Bacillota bacterium]|nr:hypothetical protein [Bacillota bacterium]
MCIFEYDEEKELALLRAAERDEGRKEGRKEAVVEMLLLLLETKGKVPENIRSRILAEESVDKLNTWVKQVLSCEKIDEFVSVLDTNRELHL